MKVNEDAWHLWSLVQTQYRASGFGLIGLDYSTLFELADRFAFDLNPAMLEKIRALEMKVLEGQGKGGTGETAG